MAPNDTTPSTGEGETPRPYAAELAPGAPDAGAGPAPRKRAPRRTTKAAAAEMTAQAAPAPTGEGETGDGTEASEAATAPRKRASRKAAATKPAARKTATRKAAEPRKRTSRKAAATEVSDASTEVSVEAEADDLLSGLAAAPVAEAAEVDTRVELEELVAEAFDAPVDEDADEAEEPGQHEEPGEIRPVVPSFSVLFQAPDAAAALAAPTRRRRRAEAPATSPAPWSTPEADLGVDEEEAATETIDLDDEATQADEDTTPRRSRRRRGGKGRRGRGSTDGDEAGSEEAEDSGEPVESHDEPADDEGATQESDEETGDEESASSRRRRRRRRAGSAAEAGDEAPNVSTRVRQPRAVSDEPTGVKGSTRLEAKKQRRREGREAGRRRTIITEAEFLARREAVDRVMVVRNKDGRTQMGVLEDGVLVEHYIDQATTVSMAGNIYLGRVQNVLPSMEAAFVDIGKGRNAVLYAGEVNWDAAGLDSNQPKRIENALSSGQTVLVQVTKDPIGHKGARLTSQISLPGRYLVYVPNSSMTGISRKLPDTERARLKKILRDVVPDTAGVIVRTAAEGASEEELRADVERLTKTWEDIQARAEAAATPSAGKSKGRKKNGGGGSTPNASAPLLLHGEPDLTVRVIRDVFNEDFKQLVVSGEQAWNEIHPYITSVAPDLADRVTKWTSEEDLFTHHRIDEQLAKAMDRKVWLPSGGSLVIDRTEAMTVVDVNTGKFVGSGGNLEETVTKNNLEAAEEIVRQLRLRDIGGIIVIDFIDMVLESNRDLVVRRLLECLGRDRTKHQVAEVTSLGLVQMTRKRVGSGLIEVFSETCDHCNGRGFIIHTTPVDKGAASNDADQGASRSSRRGRRGSSGSGNGGTGSAGNGNTGGTGASGQAEPARPSGPTAAQIAAAAHAAALKSAAPVSADAELEGAGQSLPEDDGPWAGQDEPVASQHSATDADVAELESDVDDPARPGPQAEPAVETPAEETPAEETPAEAEEAPVEVTAEEGPVEAPVADAAPQLQSEPPVQSTSQAESDQPTESAPRGRRRRGRVVAPAGPPPTTSTQA